MPRAGPVPGRLAPRGPGPDLQDGEAIARYGQSVRGRLQAWYARPGWCEGDEIWTFVQNKQPLLSYEERFGAGVGDQFGFIAVDADSKLVPHFDVGKRNLATAYRLMETLNGRMAAVPSSRRMASCPTSSPNS